MNLLWAYFRRDVLETYSKQIKHKENKYEQANNIDYLNEDLAGELGAVIQYLTYVAKGNGSYRLQLTQFFLAEVTDEQLHAQYLANKIVALGGEPTTQPRAVPAAKTNRKMVEAVLAAERQAVKDYTPRAKEAEKFGDKGMVVQLEDRDCTTKCVNELYSLCRSLPFTHTLGLSSILH